MCVYFRLLFCNPLSQTAATKPASHIHAHSSGSQRRRGPDWTFGPITPRVLAPVIFYTRKSLSVWLAFATTVESEQSAYRRISSQKKKRLLQARLELNTPTTPNPKTKLIATAEASVRQNLVLRRESLTLKVHAKRVIWLKTVMFCTVLCWDSSLCDCLVGWIALLYFLRWGNLKVLELH